MKQCHSLLTSLLIFLLAVHVVCHILADSLSWAVSWRALHAQQHRQQGLTAALTAAPRAAASSRARLSSACGPRACLRCTKGAPDAPTPCQPTFFCVACIELVCGQGCSRSAGLRTIAEQCKHVSVRRKLSMHLTPCPVIAGADTCM